ncbi:MAG: SMC-Scp complex subunit ScpB [Terriglobia bacterium]
MRTDETLKALIEAILYVAPDPVPLDAVLKSLQGEEAGRVQAKLDELITDFERPEHGIQIRQVAGGYKISSKPEHHEVLRNFVKSLKPPMRLSKPALETLAVIAYRQPATVPEIEQIRGVDCGGVIHTLLEKRLIVTAGRKNVLGRPILYRTSKEFLVHFGLKDVSELPSLREFEELAKRSLGADADIGSEPESVGSNSGPAQAASGEPADQLGAASENVEADGEPKETELGAGQEPEN